MEEEEEVLHLNHLQLDPLRQVLQLMECSGEELQRRLGREKGNTRRNRVRTMEMGEINRYLLVEEITRTNVQGSMKMKEENVRFLRIFPVFLTISFF